MILKRIWCKRSVDNSSVFVLVEGLNWVIERWCTAQPASSHPASVSQEFLFYVKGFGFRFGDCSMRCSVILPHTHGHRITQFPISFIQPCLVTNINFASSSSSSFVILFRLLSHCLCASIFIVFSFFCQQVTSGCGERCESVEQLM